MTEDMENWKSLLATWAVKQSFPVIVSLLTLYGIWHIATVVAPREFREAGEQNAAALHEAVEKLDNGFSRRMELILAAHDKDRVLWQQQLEISGRDREVLLTLLKEHLGIGKRNGEVPVSADAKP